MLSSHFIKRVLDRLDKLDEESLKQFITDLSNDREFFELIFESMIEGVMVLDEDDNIVFINKMARNMFSIYNRDTEKKSLIELCQKEDIRDFFANILYEKRTLVNHEVNLGYPNSRTLRINIFPMVYDHEVKGTILLFLDITSQKEEQFKLAQAESLASLTTLAAGVAHEIRNPLGAIDLHIQLLQRLIDDLPETKKQDFHQLLEVIDEEVERLNQIISNFLFTVRPMQIEEELIDIKDLLLDLIHFLEPQFEEKGIEISFSSQQKVPQLRADIKYIRPAFLNLLKNAYEACNTGDTIHVELTYTDQDINIIVSDTGVGIPKDKLKKIFEPYYTTKDHGTGLGLTLVHKIIKEHNGKIEVHSEVEKGTQVVVSLPRIDKKTRLIEQ